LPQADASGHEFDDVLVGVPTYNEAENAPHLVRELRQHLPGARIVVVDDSSPDGTAHLVAAMCRADSLFRLLRRPRKLGLGTAYLAAFY
jgi:dolichol-phosphate mannosyltransferase